MFNMAIEIHNFYISNNEPLKKNDMIFKFPSCTSSPWLGHLPFACPAGLGAEAASVRLTMMGRARMAAPPRYCYSRRSGGAGRQRWWQGPHGASP